MKQISTVFLGGLPTKPLIPRAGQTIAGVMNSGKEYTLLKLLSQVSEAIAQLIKVPSLLCARFPDDNLRCAIAEQGQVRYRPGQSADVAVAVRPMTWGGETIFKLLACLLVGLQATDGLLTVWAVNHGFVEQNLLMAPIADTWALPVLKIGMALLVMKAFLPLARRFGKALNSGLVMGNFILMLVIGLNILDMV